LTRSFCTLHGHEYGVVSFPYRGWRTPRFVLPRGGVREKRT
jgi:hypothetical protein